MTVTLADCLDRRKNDLAAVRMLAATAVLYAHAWIIATPGVTTADFFHIFGFSLDFHGVHAFFILSGMLLARSLMERPDQLRFMVARAVRYVPAVVVAATFAAFVVAPLATDLSIGEYFGSGRSALYVAAVSSMVHVNMRLPGAFPASAEPGVGFIPLWTIRYEIVLAFALAGLWTLGIPRMRRLALFGLVAMVPLNVVWFWNGEDLAETMGSLHHVVRFGSAFGIGVAMALFADCVPVSRRMMAAILLITAPLAYSHVAALAGMALIAYAILWLGFLGGPLAAALAGPGVWSYGFYVWGFLIEQAVAQAMPGWSAPQIFAASFVLALAAGALSWRYVERPALALTDAITAELRRRVAFLRPGEASVPVRRP